MTTAEIIFAALAACAPIVSVIVAILAFRRNNKNDIKQEAEEWGSVKSELAYIKAGIDDLKADNKKKDERLDKLGESVAKIEERIDSHIKDKNIHNYRANNRAGGHK